MGKYGARSNNLFLIGAGFTKSVFKNAPLNADLLQELIAYTSPASVLEDYQEKYKTKDIEQLLTLLDLEILADKSKIPVRLEINQQIASYFQKFRFTKEVLQEKNWLTPLASKLFTRNDSIITLNYDCFLEGLLDYFEIWSPNGGYANIWNPHADSLSENTQNIHIYKIHGSENFVESGTLPNTAQTSISFEINAAVYPRSGMHTHFGGSMIDPMPYLIAPSFVKIPHIIIAEMMIKTLRSAASAKNMVIIGCSLRPEDNFLRLLLVSFLGRPPAKRRKLILVDPSAEEIEERINDWIGNLSRVLSLYKIPSALESAVPDLIEQLHHNKV